MKNSVQISIHGILPTHLEIDFASTLRLAVVLPSRPARWQAMCADALQNIASVTVIRSTSRLDEANVCRHEVGHYDGATLMPPAKAPTHPALEQVGALDDLLSGAISQFSAIVWLDGAPPREVLEVACRLGVWTLQTDYNANALAAIANGDHIAARSTSFRLHVIATIGRAEFILNSASMRMRGLSVRRHTARILSVIPTLFANAARQLASDRAGVMSIPRFHVQPRRQVWPRHTLLSMAAFGMASLWRSLFRHEIWRIGIVRSDLQSIVRRGAVQDVTWLELKIPSSAIAADPFVLPGTHEALVCELMDYAARPGKLVMIRHDGSILPLAGDLDQTTHLSYPFVFTHEGRTFCIPETAARNEVALYEATAGLGMWRRVQVLLPKFAGLDSTVFRHDGRWWMFCAKAGDAALEDLYLFFSSDLFGQWHPHPANPVVTDVSSARPAGPVVALDGHLVRLGQDCRRSYGDAVSLRRIVRLTTEAYREEPFGAIRPESGGPYPDGIHTVVPGQGYVVVDGKRRAFVAAEFRRAVLAGLSRLTGRNRR